MARGKRAKKSNLKPLIVIIFVIVIIIFLSFFFYKIFNSDNLLDGYSLYETTNYTVQYKSDWLSTISEDTPTMTVFSSPDKLGMINIITEELPTKYTLEQYIDNSINNIKPVFHLTDDDISKELFSINGMNASRLSYKINETTTVTQTIFLSNTTVYIIAYNNATDYFDVYHNMENTLVMK